MQNCIYTVLHACFFACLRKNVKFAPVVVGATTGASESLFGHTCHFLVVYLIIRAWQVGKPSWMEV